MPAPSATTASSQVSQREARAIAAIPSWLVSLALHGALLALLLRVAPATGQIGDPEASDRVVGIYLQDGATSGVDAPGHSSETGPPSPTSSNASTTSSNEQAVEHEPPVPLDLPSRAQPVIGPGPANPNLDHDADAREMVRASGTPYAAGGGTGGGGGTTFFGHKATGRRFVYVLDASGSMYDHGAIAVAKAELMSSLAQLDASQQFQVIFYNDSPHPMVNAQGKSQLFYATDANRTLAGQFIRSVQPDLGTRHLPALLLALSFNPEVIFFLTDAGEPILDAADLDRIKRQNGGQTQVHSIEFGKGGQLKVDNFLKRLARQNAGAHVYRDVMEFRGE